MSRPNRTISLPGNDPGLDTAPPDWQLNLPRSIRDIVRRERWATNAIRHGGCSAPGPYDDGVTVRVNAFVTVINDAQRKAAEHFEELCGLYLTPPK